MHKIGLMTPGLGLIVAIMTGLGRRPRKTR